MANRITPVGNESDLTGDSTICTSFIRSKHPSYSQHTPTRIILAAQSPNESTVATTMETTLGTYAPEAKGSASRLIDQDPDLNSPRSGPGEQIAAGADLPTRADLGQHERVNRSTKRNETCRLVSR